MKNSIEKTIIDALGRVSNAEQKVEQIKLKLEKLEKELKCLEDKIFREEELISSIGYKTSSRDLAKPDTPEELKAKEEYNKKLFEEKSTLLTNYGSSTKFLEKPKSLSNFMNSAIGSMSGES